MHREERVLVLPLDIVTFACGQYSSHLVTMRGDSLRRT